MEWNDQDFKGVVFPPDGTVAPFTVINMGHGMVEVGRALHNGLPAIWFGRMESAVPVGDTVTQEPGRTVNPGESLAAITFANVESLDVVIEALMQLRGLTAWAKGE